MLWQILVTTIFGLTDAWWQCDGLGPWGNAKQIKAARQLGQAPKPTWERLTQICLPKRGLDGLMINAIKC